MASLVLSDSTAASPGPYTRAAASAVESQCPEAPQIHLELGLSARRLSGVMDRDSGFRAPYTLILLRT